MTPLEQLWRVLGIGDRDSGSGLVQQAYILGDMVPWIGWIRISERVRAKGNHQDTWGIISVENRYVPNVLHAKLLSRP